jgi:hypothetical protein
MASAEAARRYFASKESIFFGSSGVFSTVKPIIDTKYFDPFNTWYRSSNQRLRESLEGCVNFPIKTSAHDNEPRLLTITVDVITGQAVTFDSYGKKMLGTDKDGNSRYAWQSTFEEDEMYYADAITIVVKMPVITTTKIRSP